MKKSLLLLAILTVATLNMTACFSSEEPEEGQDNTSQETTADTLLDDQLLQQAVNGLDAEKCGRIEDTNKKDECKKAVGDLTIIKKAVRDMDSSLCKDIQNDRYKEECEAQIQNEIEKAKKKETFEAKLEEDAGISKKAFENKDLSLCDELQNENKKYSCRYNIIANQALDEDNIKLCEKIGEEDYIKNCESLFGIPE